MRKISIEDLKKLKDAMDKAAAPKPGVFTKPLKEYTVHGFTPDELIALREMLDDRGMNVEDLLTLRDPAKLDEIIKDSIERVNADINRSSTIEEEWRNFDEQLRKEFELHQRYRSTRGSAAPAGRVQPVDPRESLSDFYNKFYEQKVSYDRSSFPNYIIDDE